MKLDVSNCCAQKEYENLISSCMLWQRCCEEKRLHTRRFAKVTLHTAESTFKVRPPFLTSIIRKSFSSFFFLSLRAKEPALSSFDKYSQFSDTFVKFPAREEPRTLLQAIWKKKKLIRNAISIATILTILNSPSGKRQKMEFLRISEVQTWLQSFLIRGTDNMRN